jgi:hypothetical protein
MDNRPSGLRANVNEFAQPASILKDNNARYFGKEGIIASDTDIQPRFKLGSALPHKDSSAVNQLSGKTFYTKPFGLAVSSVPGASNSLFVCHTNSP